VLTDGELTEINTVVGETGDDPDLDVLLLRLHLETACTRGEALSLGTADLDVQRCVIVLRAGSADARTQPVSPSLVAALEQHVQWRPGPGPGLLRYRDGRCITARRYDHLWRRIGRQLLWVGEQQVSTGWLRRATLDRISSRFGSGVARGYVGSDVGRTVLAGRTAEPIAGLAELAGVVAWLTSEPHPLATGAVESDSLWQGFGGA
jgi:integrase/recombinase XerC